MSTDYIGVGRRNLLVSYRVQNAEGPLKLIAQINRLITNVQRPNSSPTECSEEQLYNAPQLLYKS